MGAGAPPLERAAPITWPSLSDLASSLYGSAQRLDTLGREVRRLGVTTRKIGRELRVEPLGAVRVLEARGVPVEKATELVEQAVETRTREVPTMDTRTTTVVGQADPYASLGPDIVAAMRAYEKHTFGTSPVGLVANDVPTDIASTEDLLSAVTGDRQ